MVLKALFPLLVGALLLPVVWWGGVLVWGAPKANPVEYLLLNTGEVATYLLCGTLLISPLRVFFPQVLLLKRLSGHKRTLGLGCFAYAFLHGGVYLLDRFDWGLVWDDLGRLFIVVGLGGLLVLLALALTSSNRAVKALGGRRWKRLHQAAYLAAVLVFWHMLLKEKHSPLEPLLLFVPLALLEGFRVYRFWQRRQQKPPVVPAAPAKKPS